MTRRRRSECECRVLCVSDPDRRVRMLVFAAPARLPVPLQLRRTDGLLVPSGLSRPGGRAGPTVPGHAGLRRVRAVRRGVPAGVGTDYGPPATDTRTISVPSTLSWIDLLVQHYMDYYHYN